jgi:glycosyltransferase involved in cell wall biosynthesis
MTYAIAARDPRVSNQVGWLEQRGYRVDVLSRGGAHPDASGRHFRIGFPPLLVRLAAYLLLPNQARFWFMVASRIPAELRSRRNQPYDVVVVNTIDLLPWVVQKVGRLSGGPVCLDLHEYSPSQGIGWVFGLLFRRYQDWLISFIASPVFTCRMTVADGIAQLYRDEFGIPEPGVVRNVPAFVDQSPSPVDPDRIALVHHGRADRTRGLGLMLDAMLEVDDRFVLTLMVVGSDEEVRALKSEPAVRAGRVEFRPPAPMAEVAARLNDQDAEIIFFPPTTENLRLVLPNKLFEAIQGRLGLIIGESQEMVRLVEHYGNGVVVQGWSSSDLAGAINALDAETIARMKTASDRAAFEISAETERQRFYSVLGLVA